MIYKPTQAQYAQLAPEFFRLSFDINAAIVRLSKASERFFSKSSMDSFRNYLDQPIKPRLRTRKERSRFNDYLRCWKSLKTLIETQDRDRARLMIRISQPNLVMLETEGFQRLDLDLRSELGLQLESVITALLCSQPAFPV